MNAVGNIAEQKTC